MGGYNCYCLKGYWLKRDNKTCLGKFGILYHQSVREFSLNTVITSFFNFHKKTTVFMPLAKVKYFLVVFRSPRYVRQFQTDHALSWYGSVRGDCVRERVDRYWHCDMCNTLQKGSTLKRQWHA